MIKRSLSVILALTMVLASISVFSVNAAEPTVLETVNVDANILLKLSSEGSYSDTDINITDSSLPTVDFRAELDMTKVKEKFEYYYSENYIKTVLNITEQTKVDKIIANAKVKGHMTTKINIPAGIDVNSAILNTMPTIEMNGFGSYDDVNASLPVPDIYTETSRVMAPATGNRVLTIETDIKETLGSALSSKLGNLYLECTGNAVNSFGTHTITGSIEGYTDIYYLDDTPLYRIKYKAVQNSATGEPALAETVMVSQPFTGGGGGITEVVPNIVADFSVNGNKDVIAPKKIKGKKLVVDFDEIGIPEIPGYVVKGTWSTDPEGNNPVSGKVTITEDTTFYINYVCVVAPSVFTENHVRYVQGYPDGEVKPENNVTREEVTAMLYRLLKPEVRQSLKSEENTFTDVEADRWSNVDISTMVKGGYINGYPDGTFRPGNKITRAEFVTLITRFIDDDTKPLGNVSFNDIDGHWAKAAILEASKYGVITGYPDGSFGPDKFITRAEAMTVINKLLVRYVDDDGLHEDTVHWPDNPEDAWYYHHVLEATNSHHHNRKENGYHEDWYEMTGIEDWTHE